jgi:phosphate starvation-inducible protein PhoH and related proteins
MAKRKRDVELGRLAETKEIKVQFRPLNKEQDEALRSIANPDNSIIILDGPAGSGKTHLAVSFALAELLSGKYDKMIISRPYLECDERIGMLPGDIDEKTGPFMIPLYDIMCQYMTQTDINKMKEVGQIQVRPLAYLRGCTFTRSIVILDEGQNSTVKQMQMFLTRLGNDSKVIITGDKSQSDLRQGNGFTDAVARLQGVSGLDIVKLSIASIVRHPIVQEIVKRYEVK